MANSNDTSKPHRSRRNRSKDPGALIFATTDAVATADTAPKAPSTAIPTTTPPTPPLTLQAAIESERTLLLQIRAMLHCLYEVLLYADDDDSVMHADVAYTAARLINECAMRLDSVTLRPMLDAIRLNNSEAPREDEDNPNFTHRPPYQVREPMPAYYA